MSPAGRDALSSGFAGRAPPPDSETIDNIPITTLVLSVCCYDSRGYQLFPVLAQHYSPEAAFRQKIGALSRRTVTQARDIFDLKVLLDAGAGQEKLPKAVAAEIPQAIKNAMTIGFDEFSGQVRAYLAADYQAYYGTRRVWETLQQQVVDALAKHPS